MAEHNLNTDDSINESDLQEVSGGAIMNDARSQEQADKLRSQEQADKLTSSE